MYDGHAIPGGKIAPLVQFKHKNDAEGVRREGAARLAARTLTEAHSAPDM